MLRSLGLVPSTDKEVDAMRETLAAMGSDELQQVEGAVSYLQGRWRAMKHNVMMTEYMRTVYSQPDLSKARKHADAFLPKDRHGKLYPLSTPLKSFHSLGANVALYMYMVHWWSLFFFAASLISFSTLVLNMEGDGLAAEKRNMYTIHSLGNASELSASFGGTEVVLVTLMVWFLFWQSGKMKGLARRIITLDTSAANYTVMVGRMPEHTREGEALDAFFRQWGDVVHTSVAYNHRDLILASRRRAACREALHHCQVEWYSAKANSFPEKKRKKAAARVAKAKHALYRADQHAKLLSRQQYHCCGYVFVTFDTVEAAQACIESAKSGPKYYQGHGPLEARMAPEPEDVIWENLQYSRWQRRFRYLLGVLIILAALTMSTAGITYSAASQVTLMQSFSAGGEGAPSLGKLVGSYVLLVLLLILGYVSIFALVPVFAHQLERYHTFAAREMQICYKLCFFQVLSTVLPSTFFTWVDGRNPLGTWSLDQPWYATGGTVLLTALVGDFIFVGVLVDLFRPDVVFCRRVLAPRARTQRQMNAWFKRDADIYVAIRVQLVNKMVVIGVMYGAAFPALYVLGFVFCVAAAWIDRYNLLRRLAPPPPTSDRLVANLVRVVVPCSILLHMVIAVFLFRAKADATAPATGLAYANAAVFGPLVVYFIFREWANARGRNVRVMAAHRLRTFREWFLQIQEEEPPPGLGSRHSASTPWVGPTETFRETHDLAYYVPPLTRTLLQSLGTEPAMAACHRGLATRPSCRSPDHPKDKARLSGGGRSPRGALSLPRGRASLRSLRSERSDEHGRERRAEAEEEKSGSEDDQLSQGSFHRDSGFRKDVALDSDRCSDRRWTSPLRSERHSDRGGKARVAPMPKIDASPRDATSESSFSRTPRGGASSRSRQARATRAVAPAPVAAPAPPRPGPPPVQPPPPQPAAVAQPRFVAPVAQPARLPLPVLRGTGPAACQPPRPLAPIPLAPFPPSRVGAGQ